MDRKEQIMLALLSLASDAGLRNVSLSQIAQRVGIRKASLYNHFAAKEEIVTALYEYLRAQARQQGAAISADETVQLRGRSALDILTDGVQQYRDMVEHPQMKAFFRLILSERVFSPDAADILCMETERMLQATRQLFYALQVHGILHFDHIDEDALSYAMTIHGLLEYDMDRALAGNAETTPLIQNYLMAFCQAHRPKSATTKAT